MPLIAINRGASKIKEIVVNHRERMYGVTKYKNLQRVIFGIHETIFFLLRIRSDYYSTNKSRIKKEAA